MPRLNLLNEQEINEFNNTPKFSDNERKSFFPIDTKNLASSFKSDLGLLGFTLLRGYFLATGKFYQPGKFRNKDIEFVENMLGLSSKSIITDYPESTFRLHKQTIAEQYGHTLFKYWKQEFKLETDQLVKTDLKPRQIFRTLINILREKKIEIPAYSVFTETISKSLNSFEEELIQKISNNLTEEQKGSLDHLMTMPKNSDEDIAPSNPYFLVTVKKPEQSTSLSKIRESLNEFEDISYLFKSHADILAKVQLSDQLLNYYAVWLIKSDHIQFLSIAEPSKKYLYLLSFIVYQYRIRQDYLVDTFLKVSQKFQSDVEKMVAKDFLERKPVRIEQTKKVIALVKSLSEHVSDLRHLTFSDNFTDTQKISQIKAVFQEIDGFNQKRKLKSELINKELEELENSLSGSMKDQAEFLKYAHYYRRLENKLGPILKAIDFNPKTSDKTIYQAIQFYKSGEFKKNKINPPIGFLSKKELRLLKSSDKKDSKNIYKVLLINSVSDHIKAGSLNLNDSERYKAVEELLIKDNLWEDKKAEYLDKAKLPVETEANKFIDRVRQELDKQYNLTNKNAKTNELLAFSRSGKPRVKTPKTEKEDSAGIASLFENQHVMPLPQLLADIHGFTSYLGSFEHFSRKQHHSPPGVEVFVAAIIGLGCNIGTQKMAKISKGVSPKQLNNLVQWYFSKENLDAASEKLNIQIDRLELPKIHKTDSNITHTSSDGQKFNVSVPSLNANYSFKYFGTGKGVSAYSFIDEHSRLFYNTVINSSEREAAYVIDGLMFSDYVESDIHSTDTHGYTEIVFGITNGLGVFFAPRIKNYADQLIYTFKQYPKSDYLKEGFRIIPTATTYIDEKLILEQWDNILRLLATIKLRENRASKILKRLSSYSRQHPLYKALKEVGRIYKSIYLLKYLDDLSLRQSTEKALNRIELSHKFAKAIFFGGNQELKYSTKEEQEIAVGARHLIQNAIVLWNYLKVSEILADSKQTDFKKTIEMVKNSSMMSWQHINIHGEYDFELLQLNNGQSSFEIDKIMALQLTE